ncbi:DUF4435 domain-containing protein [Idiomarina sp. ST10R2A5]|uniref:DUF4435 domain-containing protein n=1 Tax=Idiomarina sp. ST10R2A5 TaxID=3418368 RepID=UPI003EC4AB9A
MAELEHSNNAKNILKKFYRVDKIVFVEGSDDIPFWEIVFNKFYPSEVKIEPVGGKPKLKNYIEQVMQDEANFFVAMDLDYDGLFEHEIEHQAIFTTAGYSIENSLVTAESLSKIIKNLCRLSAAQEPKILTAEWIANSSQSLKPLLVLDIINQAQELGKKVTPDNADRFFQTTTCASLCSDKIKQHYEQLNLDIPEDTIEYWEAKVENSDLSVFDLTRGHFIFSAAMRYVRFSSKQFGKRLTISGDALYSNLIQAFELVFNTNHPHFKVYEDSFKLLPEVPE